MDILLIVGQMLGGNGGRAEIVASKMLSATRRPSIQLRGLPSCGL